MTFDKVLAQVLELLQREKRVSYRALKVRFHLDDEILEAVKDELLYAQQVARDEDNRVLVWVGEAEETASLPAQIPRQSTIQATQPTGEPPLEFRLPEAERRQLTVMFCDMVNSTKLSSQLDLEDYREVVRAYQATCTEVIYRFDGHIAQYLGDGLLVYFGYPVAHEEDAQRAVHSGLGIIEALRTLNTRLEPNEGVRLAVRLGIHTGLVVVGAMGGAGRQEQLALGEVPNVASRIQAIAHPDTVVMSADTYRLVLGFFECEPLGEYDLRGVSQPIVVYRVLQASETQSRLDVASARGLTPLVGRDAEVNLLIDRWNQAKTRMGQIVLLNGEPGLGKSRLVQTLKEHLVNESHTRLECRSFPYYQNTAFYPIIDLIQRLLQWEQGESADDRLGRLEQAFSQYRLSREETVSLMAGLLSLPLPEDKYPPLHLAPQRQRQKTLETIVALLLELAERQPVLFIVEDLHWTDPSTLELLNLLIDQMSTTSIYTLLTYRPEFQAPWRNRSYFTQVTLNRLSGDEAEQMVIRMTGGKPLPGAIIQQLVDKTDGVPLYVEEMTKAVLESGVLKELDGQYEFAGPLSSLLIPSTLQDSLMARLDRLGTGKAVAQCAAVIGRQFSYALLRAISPWEEAILQHELRRLVEAELVYQQGAIPNATYLFKHALVQDIAYESLLRRTRQQYHAHIAHVLATRFPNTNEAQPELLAHHYTEAGLYAQAIGYWQQAGQQAIQRSANLEASQHLTTGLALLATLPETLSRAQQELDLRMALGPALIATHGPATPEVEQTYARTRALCQQIGETPQLFSTLWGLCRFYRARGALPTARELGEQLYRLAQREAAPTPRLEAHDALGSTLFHLGEYATALTHLEQGIALTDPTVQQALALRHDVAPGVTCLAYAANILWCLGFPAQAVRRSQEALALAQTLSHPYSLVFARYWAALLHHRRREASAVQAQAEALLTLATAQGFPLWVGLGTCCHGWSLAMQGQGKAGMTQMRQGLAVILAAGYMLARPLCLVLLAEAAGHVGQVEEGSRLLAEALVAFEDSGRGDLLAETYRLQGKLLLRQGAPDAEQAEACFQQAVAVARHQQAKSWELRAVMSLARLWQHQGKRAEARELLAPVYGWFTEGFDTADLQDAKALLNELEV